MRKFDLSLRSSRSEERFSRNAETDLVCRLLLEKKKRADGAQQTKAPGQTAGYRTRMRRSRFRLQPSQLTVRIRLRKTADHARPRSLPWPKSAPDCSNRADTQPVPALRGGC